MPNEVRSQASISRDSSADQSLICLATPLLVLRPFLRWISLLSVELLPKQSLQEEEEEFEALCRDSFELSQLTEEGSFISQLFCLHPQKLQLLHHAAQQALK